MLYYLGKIAKKVILPSPNLFHNLSNNLVEQVKTCSIGRMQLRSTPFPLAGVGSIQYRILSFVHSLQKLHLFEITSTTSIRFQFIMQHFVL